MYTTTMCKGKCACPSRVFNTHTIHTQLANIWMLLRCRRQTRAKLQWHFAANL